MAAHTRGLTWIMRFYGRICEREGLVGKKNRKTGSEQLEHQNHRITILVTRRGGDILDKVKTAGSSEPEGTFPELVQVGLS